MCDKWLLEERKVRLIFAAYIDMLQKNKKNKYVVSCTYIGKTLEDSVEFCNRKKWKIYRFIFYSNYQCNLHH